MNLMNCFNFSYLKQNLKKSRVTLSFMLSILPILTFIVLLLVGKREEIMVLDLGDVSGLTAFGMYVIPVALSLLLFNFVFKKKSVDFMGSMPINRKTIFFTNTLGGIFILAILLLGTTLLMIVTATILPNLYIPLGVGIDYFILFLISYIFVFVSCNIAVSLSGNVMTSIVVTLLILFFIPFHHFAFKNFDWNSSFHTRVYEKEYSSDVYTDSCDKQDRDCLEKNNYSVSYFQPIMERTNYTMPFGIFANSTDDLPDTLTYRNDVVWKMIILSLIYILLGCLLFEKKEMEICETSFKKYWQHQLVKVLTLIPIFVLASAFLFESDSIAWVLVLSIILIYNFIYDLLTRHSIEHIFINLGCFAVTFMIVCFTTTMYLNDVEHSYIEKDTIIDLESIENIQIEMKHLDLFGLDEWVTIDNREIIKEVITNQQGNSHNTSFIVTIHGKKYSTSNYFSDEMKKTISEIAKSTGQYEENKPQEILKHREVITIGDDYQVLDDRGAKLLDQSLKKGIQGNLKNSIPIHIYVYEKHSLNCYTVYSNIDPTLQKYIFEKMNEKVRNANIGNVYAIEFSDFTISTIHHPQYILPGTRNAKDVIELLLKRTSIDFEKPIYRVSIYCGNQHFYYYMNLDEEILSFLEPVESSFDDEEAYVD